MQPSPMAETSKLLFPSLRFCIFELLSGRDHQPATRWLLSGSCGPCRILAQKDCSVEETKRSTPQLGNKPRYFRTFLKNSLVDRYCALTGVIDDHAIVSRVGRTSAARTAPAMIHPFRSLVFPITYLYRASLLTTLL